MPRFILSLVGFVVDSSRGPSNFSREIGYSSGIDLFGSEFMVPDGASKKTGSFQTTREACVNIRRLTKPHAAEYRALMLEAYQLHPDAFTSSYADRSTLALSWWESRLDHGPEPTELVFGVFHEGRISGVAGLSFDSREKARHKATLFGMYVPSQFRRQGFANQLVRAVLSEAKVHPQLKLLQLSVTHGNRVAELLYERCGFTKFGLEPYAVAVGDKFVSKVHMWCNLGNLDGWRD